MSEIGEPLENDEYDSPEDIAEAKLWEEAERLAHFPAVPPLTPEQLATAELRATEAREVIARSFENDKLAP